MAKAAHGETTSEDLLLRVDPRIATGGHGHCFPVASMPFSKTFEYCYDDWSIAHVARKLGKTDDAAMLAKRSTNYRNYFDASVGFMRLKLEDGSWE
jgi:putative alpha-1,2-mannosidase